MPYGISQNQSDCANWAAVVREDNGSYTTIGCHANKQDAIDQMVAASIDEGTEPLGEVQTRLSKRNMEPIIDGIIVQLQALKQAYLNYEMEEDEDEGEMESEDRAVSFDVPQYIRSAARRGLELHEEGKSGNLASSTVPEAREMAAGNITEDKVIRANAWGKRHLVDLDSPANSNPNNEDFPSFGAVAFYLWGINPLNPQPAMDWFERQAERVREDEESKSIRASDFKTGDFVSWNSSGGRARGRITRIVRDGSVDVPDSSFTINGTEDDPAALIRVYARGEEGWEPTDRVVGHRFSTLTKIENLERSQTDDKDDKNLRSHSLRVAAQRAVAKLSETK